MSFTKLVLCLVYCIFCLPVCAIAAEPNIIFILTDDQRLEDIQHMPILQRLLVQQGMLFENYFANVSLCCPSRTSMLRGQFAHNTGVMTNGGDNGGFEVAHSRGIEDSTIAVWLHEHGYKTALIGKYLNHYPGAQGPTYVPPGWDYWASAVRGNAYGEYNYTLNENGHLVEYGEKPEDYGTDVYTRQAVSFIKDCNSAKKPFFIYLAFYAPHGPATPAPRHMNLFSDAKIPRTKAFNEADVSLKPQFIQRLSLLTEPQVAVEDEYYGKRLRSLQAVDEAIETLTKTLSEVKQLDNTYIVFAADNGFHLGEHRMRRGKQTAYETDIHLPLIVRGPGVAHGATAKEMVGNIDLAPTFADLAGAKTPDFVDGRSIATILKGHTPKNWREVFLVEHALAGGAGGGRGGGKRARRNSQASRSTSVTTAEFDTSSKVSNKQALTAYSANEDKLEQMELAQEKAPTAPPTSEPQEDTLQMNDVQSKDATRRERRQRKRRRMERGGAPSGREMSGIPPYHALRGTRSTFVEYTTGEREYYLLTEDPDQINNLAAKGPAKDIEQNAARAQQLSTSAAQNARQIESGK